jgi:hypothetical protein
MKFEFSESNSSSVSSCIDRSIESIDEFLRQIKKSEVRNRTGLVWFGLVWFGFIRIVPYLCCLLYVAVAVSLLFEYACHLSSAECDKLKGKRESEYKEEYG